MERRAAVRVPLGGSPEDLGKLVSKSIVAASSGGRYRLLVPVRLYARALLDDAGELLDAERARSEHFAALAAELGSGARRDLEGHWQQRFAAERVHLVAALDALHHTDPDRAAALAVGLAGYWATLGLYSEGMRVAERALVATTDVAVRVELNLLLAHVRLARRGRRHRCRAGRGTGDPTTAAKLLAWADNRRETLGVARDPFEEDQVAILRSRVGGRSEEPHAKSDTADLLVESLG